MSPFDDVIIIWINAGLLLNTHVGTNFDEIESKYYNIKLENIVRKMAAILCWPQWTKAAEWCRPNTEETRSFRRLPYRHSTYGGCRGDLFLRCSVMIKHSPGQPFNFGILRTNINLSPPSAYMRQWSGSSLVQVMACRLFGDKPLNEPMLAYYQLDSWEHILEKIESESIIFIKENAIENVVCQNGGHFVQG